MSPRSFTLRVPPPGLPPMGGDTPDAPPSPPRRPAPQWPPRREPPLLPSPWAVATAAVPHSPVGTRVVPVTARGAVAAYVTAAVPWLVVRFACHCGTVSHLWEGATELPRGQAGWGVAGWGGEERGHMGGWAQGLWPRRVEREMRA